MISPSNTDKSDKDLWATPKQVFTGFERYLSEIYDGFKKFTLDACALPHNKKVERFISPSQNTFKTDWGNGEFVWMNPPYSYPLAFIERAIEMSQKNFVALLLPSDTSTEWFSRCVECADTIIFATGKGARIHFEHNNPDLRNQKSNGNVKGSILVVFQKILPKSSQQTRYVPLKDIYNK